MKSRLALSRSPQRRKQLKTRSGSAHLFLVLSKVGRRGRRAGEPNGSEERSQRIEPALARCHGCGEGDESRGLRERNTNEESGSVAGHEIGLVGASQRASEQARA